MISREKTLFISMLLALISFSSYAQIVTIKADKLEVRDIHGKHIASGYYSNMVDAVAGDQIVVIWYQNGKVEVRTEKLVIVSSAYYSNLKRVAASGKNVVLYYTNDKVEVRDVQLKQISSWYL